MYKIVNGDLIYNSSITIQRGTYIGIAMIVWWIDSVAGVSVELTLSVVIAATFVVAGVICLKKAAGSFVRCKGH